MDANTVLKQTANDAKDVAEKYIIEFLKCKQDFVYFCGKYIYIESPGKDKILTPYEPQKELIDLINQEHYALVLKSRQIGISTIIQAYVVWLCCFFDNAVVGIISKDGKEATDFARTIRGMLEKLPKWLGISFNKKTEQSFILTNGAKVYATPVNPNAPEKTLRGKAITFLVIDEAAFIKFLDEAWTAMVSALSTNQMQAKQAGVPYGTVILSTPNKTVGPGKWFYERYQRSVMGDDIFKPFTIHWRQVKELANDPDWYNMQCAMFDNDSRKIQQELELKFLATSGSFFDEETTQKLQEIHYNPIEKFQLFNGEGWRFQAPQPGAYYMLGVDTAPEHGDDKSAIVVWDYKTLEQVFEYQGKSKVSDFVKVVKAVASQYNGIIVIESNSYGNHVVEEMNMSEYSARLYKEKRPSGPVPGLSTNTRTRPLMIDALYSYITECPEIVKSQRLILELIGLISKPSGRVEADIGCHDDLALATALCFYVRKYDPPLMIESEENVNSSLFREVMGMNDFVYEDSDFSNSSIIRTARHKIENGESGFMNTMSIFGSDRG